MPCIWAILAGALVGVLWSVYADNYSLPQSEWICAETQYTPGKEECTQYIKKDYENDR